MSRTISAGRQTGAVRETAPGDQALPARTANRTAALGGIGFAAIVITENILRGPGPDTDASTNEVLDYYASHRTLVTVATGLFVLTFPCIMLFAGGLWRAFAHHGVARSGVPALYAMLASFTAVMVADVSLNVLVHDGRADAATTGVLWSMRGAALMLNGGILGSGVLLMAQGAGCANALPRWLRPLGTLCGILAIISCVGLVPAMDGAAIGLAGLAAFACWLVWLLAASVSLWRHA